MSVIRTLILAALAVALATVNVAAAILALTASSALLLAWIYRKPWSVGWLTALGPCLAGILTLVAQRAIPLPDLPVFLPPAAGLGAVAGVVLAFFHRLEHRGGRWEGAPAMRLILLWGLGLLLGQGTALHGDVVFANYGVAASVFTSALLAAFFLSLLIRRLTKRSPPKLATPTMLLLLALAMFVPAHDLGDGGGWPYLCSTAICTAFSQPVLAAPSYDPTQASPSQGSAQVYSR